MERRLMRAADAVTCVTRPVAEDLDARIGARSTVVPHGFDPELIASVEQGEAAAQSLLDPERVSVVYTGRFGAHERDHVPLARALRALAAEEPAVAERIELVIAGSMRPEERELLEGLAPLRVSLLGALPHRRALGLQRAADVLLLFGSRRAQVANLKLYEYLGAARPILALAEGTEAGRIVAETGGLVVPADDPRAIQAAFRRAARGDLSDPDPESTRKYAYPGPAEQMADAVESAIARATARADRWTRLRRPGAAA
jgi:glycosyltransferase involved in cell wall biosynthesis